MGSRKRDYGNHPWWWYGVNNFQPSPLPDPPPQQATAPGTRIITQDEIRGTWERIARESPHNQRLPFDHFLTMGDDLPQHIRILIHHMPGTEAELSARTGWPVAHIRNELARLYFDPDPNKKAPNPNRIVDVDRHGVWREVHSMTILILAVGAAIIVASSALLLRRTHPARRRPGYLWHMRDDRPKSSTAKRGDWQWPPR